jgi:anti-sigma factor RsiW
MKTHLKEEDYIPYLDGCLEAAERTEVDQHLAACDACRTRLGEMRSLMGVLDEWKAAEASPAFDAALRARLDEEKTKRVGWFVFPGPRAFLKRTRRAWPRLLRLPRKSPRGWRRWTSPNSLLAKKLRTWLLLRCWKTMSCWSSSIFSLSR